MEENTQQPEPDRRTAFRQAVERANARASARLASQAELQARAEAELQAEEIVPARPYPLDAARLLELDTPAPPEIRRPPLMLAPLAGLAWGGVILLLIFGRFGPHAAMLQRLLYSVLLLTAGVLTFIPLQWSLRLPALSWRGVTGWSLLFYLLAFVPAPTRALIPLDESLPDLPIYIVMFIAVFLAANAAATPVLYVLGMRLFRRRTRRFDLGRVSREAIEFGIFAVGLNALWALNALNLISLILLTAILIFLEIFILGGQEGAS